MLDQLIYTRCSPHRDLKNGGQVIRGDGFGVFSVNQELFKNKNISNYDFLLGRLSIPNGAKESSPIGLFNSYEYTRISHNTYAITFEVARPHCKVPRKNGQTHRTGTYIKQCFVGEFNTYPFEWFESSSWNAYHISENDYYLDNSNDSATTLNQVSDKPANGHINTTLVKEFVNDGRITAVKDSLYFLFQEFEKNEGERRVLIIKDTPQNVELWIAAIEYGFSVEMATKITFITNRTKLGTQADSVLFYYSDENGRFYPMMNSSVKQTRHPYNMIVGCHPKDNFSASLKQMPTSNYVILDGATKGFVVPFSNQSTNRAYYSAVVQYEADIQDFCSIVLPSIPLKELTGKLPDLFDAYKYLLDSNHKSDKWMYSETIFQLDTLLQFGMLKNSSLVQYLLDECLNVYADFANEDESNSYNLIKLMYNLAKSVKREREVTGCLADIISNKLCNPRNSDIDKTWKNLKLSNVSTILQPALKDLFNDTELPVYAKKLKSCDASTITTTLDMFMNMIIEENIPVENVTNSDVKFSFLCSATIALLDDSVQLINVMKNFHQSTNLFNSVTVTIAKYLIASDPAKINIWWDVVIDVSGGNLVELCKTLCMSNVVDMFSIEQLLCSRVFKTRKFDNQINSAFCESLALLSKQNDTGKYLFNAAIDVTPTSEIVNVIKIINKYELSQSVSEELFIKVNNKMPYDLRKGASPLIYRELKVWGNTIGLNSIHSILYDFKCALEKERKAEKANDLINSLVQKNLYFNKNFLESVYFNSIASYAAQFCDANINIAMLCLFESIDGANISYCVDKYLSIVLENTKGKNFVPLLISICEATMFEYKIPGRTSKYVGNVQHSLESSFKEHIVGYYKPTLIEQVAKYNNCDKAVINKLVKILQEASEKATPKGIGGFFNNLFGKK